ncbi:PAS domain-containing protein [Dongia mobilis]|uniref:PAS domain-containing protein n=1 Tax=Dongia mobilis TaxID=578943 RepID=A0A4R6WRT5_9PROT|nr:PAS domain-containing protein [Dongia mobilis]TDQ84322.1 PAS domain-containing protein [Dongia mobilis]
MAPGQEGDQKLPDFCVIDAAVAEVPFRSPRVAHLYRYWRELCGGRQMPSRVDLDPAAIRDLLPYLLLVDMVGTPPRARYRVVGTVIVEMAKFDFTGLFADEIDFKESEEFDYGGAYANVASWGKPGLGHSAMLVEGFKSRWVEFVICPLSEDGQTVSQCVALEDYEPTDLIERDSMIPAVRR